MTNKRHILPVREWSPIQQNKKCLSPRSIIVSPCKSSNHQNSTYHSRSKPYRVSEWEDSFDNDSNCKSNTNTKCGNVAMSLRIFWYKYFVCFSRKKKSEQQLRSRQQRGITEVAASLNIQPSSDW